MKRLGNRRLVWLIAITCLAVFIGYNYWCSRGSLRNIRKRGKLIALMENNATCYYLYKDTPMGFEYDLVKAFADHLGVALEVKTPGWNALFNFLERKDGDIIAAGMTYTPGRDNRVDFSTSYLSVKQNIIIHKSNRSIKSIDDLNGVSIHVREGTTYQQRLEELKKKGINLTIVTHKNIPTEELIEMVEKRKIVATVADSNIALLNRRYYPDIKIAFPISKKQDLAWAVRNGDRGLLSEINWFFARIKANGTFKKIYNRYYGSVDHFDYVDIKKFHRRIITRLPEFKTVIKQESERYGFDWRLIAAVIYQESHLDPFAQSYTGTRGMMQLTRTTAKEMGVSNRFDWRQNIRGGVAYLAKLTKRFDDIKDPRTRLLFALASYNIGYGHVRDAQQIAMELGEDPKTWDGLKKALPLLRRKEYYSRTKHGYARGTEPVTYIEHILTYYDILKQKTI